MRRRPPSQVSPDEVGSNVMPDQDLRGASLGRVGARMEGAGRLRQPHTGVSETEVMRPQCLRPEDSDATATPTPRAASGNSGLKPPEPVRQRTSDVRVLKNHVYKLGALGV